MTTKTTTQRGSRVYEEKKMTTTEKQIKRLEAQYRSAWKHWPALSQSSNFKADQIARKIEKAKAALASVPPSR
jgi:thymidylate synthase